MSVVFLSKFFVGLPARWELWESRSRLSAEAFPSTLWKSSIEGPQASSFDFLNCGSFHSALRALGKFLLTTSVP
jgi:hypothetical protein